MKSLTFTITIDFAGPLESPTSARVQVARKIVDALVHTVGTAGLAPDDNLTETFSISSGRLHAYFTAEGDQISGDPL